MRFGIFSVADHYPTELRRSATELYGELLDQAEAADALGFDSFWIAEHHFHEYGAIPRPPVWLAAAAERTRRIRPYAVQRPFETLVAQNVVAFGDPDEIVRVARLYEAAGFTHFLAIANFGGLPHMQVLRSMELMARHVLPRFSG